MREEIKNDIKRRRETYDNCQDTWGYEIKCNNESDVSQHRNIVSSYHPVYSFGITCFHKSTWILCWRILSYTFRVTTDSLASFLPPTFWGFALKKQKELYSICVTWKKFWLKQWMNTCSHMERKKSLLTCSNPF